MKKLYLGKFFAAFWRGREPFEEVAKLDATVFPEGQSRRTLRFVSIGARIFLKRTIWDRLAGDLERPFSVQMRFWRGQRICALRKLAATGCATMTPEAYGNAASTRERESSLWTAELRNVESLEDITRD